MKNILFNVLKVRLAKAAFVCLCMLGMSCEEFLQIDAPQSTLTDESIFSSDATATSAMLGVYGTMNGTFGPLSGNSSMSVLLGLSADELQSKSSNAATAEFYASNVLSTNTTVLNTWKVFYNYIYLSNSVLEGLANSTQVTPTLKKTLEGEALFVRAFCHFYLTNLFGDVPLIKGTDYRDNQAVVKTSSALVYASVVEDLLKAKMLLPAEYVTDDNGNAFRTRPNRMAAAALLARVYLYDGQWAKAEEQATEVISDKHYTIYEDDLTLVFKKESEEAIWQLYPSLRGYGVYDADALYVSPTSLPTLAVMTTSLVEAFEDDDARKAAWIVEKTPQGNSFFQPLKYTQRRLDNAATDIPIEYLVVLRTAEQYLIRAEARAKQNDIDGAKEDLNVLRSRADLDDTDADATTIFAAIEYERQVELFTEFGHRWFDLKRTDRATQVLAPIKGGNWQESDLLLPIPESEVKLNPNL